MICINAKNVIARSGATKQSLHFFIEQRDRHGLIPFGLAMTEFNQKIPRCSASGFPNNSLPIEGGGLGWGCFVMIIFDTLPFIPSPQGRGDIRYLVPKAFGTTG
jgi:hypothetical protein